VVLRPLFSPLGTSLRDTLSGNTWQKGTVENTNRGARPLSADCFAIACRAMGGCRVTAISASSLITTSRRSVTTSTIRRANVSDGRRQQKHSEKTCWRKWVDHPTLKSNSGRSSGIAHTIGIDVSKGKLDVFDLVGLEHHQVANNSPGSKMLQKMIAKLGASLVILKPLASTTVNSKRAEQKMQCLIPK
jgi:hypothetical protein